MIHLFGEMKLVNHDTGEYVSYHNATLYTYGQILQKALIPSSNVKRTINYMYIEYYNSIAPENLPTSVNVMEDPITSYYNLIGTTYTDRGYLKVPIILSSETSVDVDGTLFPGLTFVSVVSGTSAAGVAFNNTSVIYGGSLVSCNSSGTDPIVWSRGYLPANKRLNGGINIDYHWTISFNAGVSE